MEPIPLLPIPSRTPELAALFDPQVAPPDPETGCQLWKGPRFETGYGRFYVPSGLRGKAGRVYRAHRVAYAWKHGDPGQAVLDHLCHDPLVCFDSNEFCVHRRCVNPDHVEPTTRGDNVRRGLPGSPLWHPLGNSLKQVCVNGHEFSEENTYVNPRGERQCRACLRDATKRHTDANRERINAKRRATREHITYEPKPCEHCGTIFQPERSTARYCDQKSCLLSRQREGRLRRLGR